ncbi:MAG: protocatechuate 3,4-dioxygenase subunit beta [Microbacteriaceae bacterium]
MSAPTAKPAHLLPQVEQGLISQAEISAQIQQLHSEYESSRAAGGLAETQPRLNFAPYRSSLLRFPTKNPKLVDPETIELLSPAFGQHDVSPIEADLTLHHIGEPLGERITVSGRVVDGEGRPVRNQLVEVWQANASGRYIHQRDQHPAPLDPNFTGAGRAITDNNGEYKFVTIKPGPYPWRNHANAWRPAHIHFSLFGNAFTQRIVTQMYFPNDPLFALDPIYQSIVDPKARESLIAKYVHDESVHEWSMGYRFDIVLTGPSQTWFEAEGDDH